MANQCHKVIKMLMYSNTNNRKKLWKRICKKIYCREDRKSEENDEEDGLLFKIDGTQVSTIMMIFIKVFSLPNRSQPFQNKSKEKAYSP